MVFESLKPLAGSNVKRHIEERSQYWGAVAQCTQNKLVNALTSGFKHLASSAQKFENVGQLKALCEKETTHHGIVGFGSMGAIAHSIAARDVLHYIEEGTPLLPADVFNALAEIERTKLIVKIANEQQAPAVTAATREADIRRHREAEQREQNERAERLANGINISTSQPVQKKPAKTPSGKEGWMQKVAEERKKIFAKREEQ